MGQGRKVKVRIDDMDAVHNYPNTTAQLEIYEKVNGQWDWVATFDRIEKSAGAKSWTKRFELGKESDYKLVAGYALSSTQTVSEAQVFGAGSSALNPHFGNLQKPTAAAGVTGRPAVGISILDPHCSAACVEAEVEIRKRVSSTYKYIITLVTDDKDAACTWHDSIVLNTALYLFIATDLGTTPACSETQPVTVGTTPVTVSFANLA